MKKIIYAIVLGALLFSSCEDYLNVKPRGYDIASKMEHYRGLLYGTEPFLMDVSFPYMCFEMYTDVDGYAQLYTNVGSYATNAYKWAEDIYREDQICGEWNSFATLLYNCNIVINEVLDAEDGTPEERLALQSEARMIRAYCTFMMSQFFGKAPILTSATTELSGLPIHPAEEINGFVLAEMSEAVGLLPDLEEHHRRVFKASGLGLYGKVLFMLGMYDEAAVQFEKAFASLRSTSPWFKLIDFNTQVDANKDIAYTSFDNENSERLYVVNSMPRLWEAVIAGMYGQLMTGVKNELLERFFPDMHDTRLCFYSSIQTTLSAYSTYKPNQQYAASMTSNRLSSNFGLDLSELYTMYAECLARQQKTDKAAELLLELRAHRLEPGHEGIPAEVVTADQFTVFAFEERMREQIGFGSSWFDMKRLWNDPLFQYLKPMYVHPVGPDESYSLTEERLYMKIPPTVLAWHPEYADNQS